MPSCSVYSGDNSGSCYWSAAGEYACARPYGGYNNNIEEGFRGSSSQQQSQQQQQSGGASVAVVAPPGSAKQKKKAEVRWSVKLPETNNGPNSNRHLLSPYQVYVNMVKKLGPPDALDPEGGGFALWNRKAISRYPMLKRVRMIEVSDDDLRNDFPFPHSCFVRVEFDINVPVKKLYKVLSMSGDLSYDTVRRHLIVRGMSLSYCAAMASLVRDFADEKISWDRILNERMVESRLRDSDNPEKVRLFMVGL